MLSFEYLVTFLVEISSLYPKLKQSHFIAGSLDHCFHWGSLVDRHNLRHGIVFVLVMGIDIMCMECIPSLKVT